MAQPPLSRWLGIALRGAHLTTVIFLGASLLTGTAGHGAIAAVLLSGAILFLLDLWIYPGHLHEIAGISVLIKLLLIATMAIDPALRLPMFWLVIFWSVLFSHAPASVRHRRWTRGAR